MEANQAQERGPKRPVDAQDGVERLDSAACFTPAVDIWETDQELALAADLPGCPPEAVDLTVEKSVLTLSARPDASAGGPAGGHREYEAGPFERSFTLPDGLDRAAISAKVADGVLTVRIPKIRDTARRVAIG